MLIKEVGESGGFRAKMWQKMGIKQNSICH
jgi:hypothetical protein